MRAMRLAKREVCDRERQRAIVEACQVLRLGLADAEGMFIVPVNYGYRWVEDEGGAVQLSFYLHSAREGRKAEALAAAEAHKTPVAIELDRDDGNISGDFACAWSRGYRSIMGSGTARLVTDDDEKAAGLRLIMEHAAGVADAAFEPAALARVAVFRIDATQCAAKERHA